MAPNPRVTTACGPAITACPQDGRHWSLIERTTSSPAALSSTKQPASLGSATSQNLLRAVVSAEAEPDGSADRPCAARRSAERASARFFPCVARRSRADAIYNGTAVLACCCEQFAITLGSD